VSDRPVPDEDVPQRGFSNLSKRFAAAVVSLCTLGGAFVAAEKVFVNPHPEAHLKALFPNAVAFTPRAGNPPVFKAYAVDPASDPSAAPIGFAFWTPEILPEEHGYHGPIHIIVGMDTMGILTGAIVDYHSEPYGYFSVEPPEFAAQFKGKSVRDPFKVGGDVVAVSRASISINSATRAVRDSARMVARAFLAPEAVKR
jgi:transcriptional regulator of nitric oxide reductase